MAENNIRLYKVAKELNVSSETLVEYLHKQGHKEVTSDLNAKITDSQHEVLIKQFGSDKLQKEKAEEKKLLHKSHEYKAEEDSLHPISHIKKEIIVPQHKVVGKIDLDALKRDHKKPEIKKETPSVPIQEEKPTVIVPPVVTELPAPPPTEVVQPLVPELPPVVEGLKDTLKLAPKIKKKETPPPPVDSEVIKETLPLKETPVIPSAKDEPIEKILPVQNIEELPEEQDVMRASEKTPQLSGLKVVGKIILDDPKKKKKEKDKRRERIKTKDPVDSASNTPDERKRKVGANRDEPKKERPMMRVFNPDQLQEHNLTQSKELKNAEGKPLSAEEAAKKRKRKRKRAGGVTSNDTNVSAPKREDDKPKREKASEKQVKDSIRKTLDEMDKGAGRTRQRARRNKRDEALRKREEQEILDGEESKILRITEFITANEFANLIDVPVTDIISKCFQLGMMISINQRLDADVINLIAEEYDYSVEFVDVNEEDLEEDEQEELQEDLVKRNPVITVMGHVDHGKTTLLDYLRKANVAAGEAGGITQHIGAYQVKLKSGDSVTFLDTPGHEAFTAMRARGTKVTDVAIIVIAADDAVMPTTREAISHAQAANVPMVFAINKIDKPGADSDRIRTQLADMNLLVEDWGGKYQCQEISAKQGLNIEALLDRVLLEAEILDLKANPNRPASGNVIESRVDKGRGTVVTMLVQNGTIKVGDTLVAGIHSGKVKALFNQNNQKITSAGPSMPVQILGISGQPQAGDKFQVYAEDSKAKEISQRRQELHREQQLRQNKHITLEEISRRRLLGNFKELNLVIKGDVDGSVEALSGALLRLSTPEVAVNIILKGTGPISESDVLLASASDALIIAFNVRPGSKARELADKEGVNIRLYSIIYNVIDDVTDALEGLLAPEVKEEIIANVEVRQVFNISKVGNIAGCYVSSGKVHKNDRVRVIREGIVVGDGTVSTLKRYKDDVKEVSGGYECGIQISNFNDLETGDTLEIYKVTEIKRKFRDI